MHEVRVYDSKGALKKVISEKVLKDRSDHQIMFPSGYGKRGNKPKPGIPEAPKRKQAKSA